MLANLTSEQAKDVQHQQQQGRSRQQQQDPACTLLVGEDHSPSQEGRVAGTHAQALYLCNPQDLQHGTDDPLWAEACWEVAAAPDTAQQPALPCHSKW